MLKLLILHHEAKPSGLPGGFFIGAIRIHAGVQPIRQASHAGPFLCYNYTQKLDGSIDA